MRLRGVVIGVLAMCGVFAAAASRNCGTSVPVDWEPAVEPSLASADPSEATQAYWLAARRVSKKCARATVSREHLRSKTEAVKSPADGERVWAELARDYSGAAAVRDEAVKEIRLLPPERVNPAAIGCVTELADVIALQGDLLRKCGEQCGEMAALYAAVRAEGGAFDWNGPKGKEYERREIDLTAEMRRVMADEGAAEKRRLAELAAKAKAAAHTLEAKHVRRFPDLLGN